MSTSIVTVNVSQTIAPTPNNLQKKGAMISQGGTTLTAGQTSFLSQYPDLTPLLAVAKAITSIAWSGNVATVTTTAAHGLTLNDVIELTIAGVTSTTVGAYNGTFACTITGASAFTFPLPLGGTPGAGTGGTWVSASKAELIQMATTFFDPGSSQGVYVLELGIGNPAQGVAALQAFIAASSPQLFYAYLVPRLWDSVTDYITMLGQFNGTTKKTYFFTTTSIQNYANYTALMKCCFALIECPSYGLWAQNTLTGLSFSGSWGSNVITNSVWSASNGGQATYTTTSAHGVSPGQTAVITGSTPAGYNGTFTALPGTTGSTIVVSMPVNPGAISIEGTLSASVQGTATATTASAHGVLPGQTVTLSGSIPTAYNGTFTALPGTTGSTLLYALPSNPGSETTLGQLNTSSYTSSGIAAGTEFSAAAPFFVVLNYAPSTTNKVTPTAFSFLTGVTPFPTQGNGSLLAALKAAGVNTVGTGAEGGISNAILNWGTTMDGRDFTYWYSVDWVQINVDLAIANAIINGSNNPINPLYYNQDGINRLQQVAARVMNNGVTFGLVLGAVKQTQFDGPALGAALSAGTFDNLTDVNAIPFVPYSAANPNDYAIGQYNGLSTEYTPARGFVGITYNINVTDFVTQ